jgi:hypothetical protein
MKKRLIFLIVLAFGFIFAFPDHTFAQGSQDVEARKAQLEAELANLEKQIEVQRDLVRNKQREKVSLERDITILDAQIAKAKLEIKARDIAIAKLGTEIGNKNIIIGNLDQEIEREKRSLAQLLRKTRELDHASLILVALTNETISDFFSDLDDFESIQTSLQSSFTKIRETRGATEEEKGILIGKREEEQELRQLQVLEKNRIEENEAEKKRILTVTKGEEARYQEILSGQEKTAAQIRSALFELRGTAAIPFGQALDYANFASGKTGVRPAFILGVIAEESNLGENVGTGTWTEDMHPDRDRPVFQKITEVLGLNPDRTPVSKAPWYGWGGAMGPAQFIPSTWACYGGFINTTTGKCGKNPDGTWVGPWEYSAQEDVIRNLLGKGSPSNPWEPRDAFMASATLLKENGADARTYEAERLAALRYFAGWGNANKPAYAFYGDDVMALAAKYQSQIDILTR